ncbi:dihydroorotase family protein [Fibrella sp. WM1]|uniref:dihydroorotase n=1 Tax=Fibrella musci TaxID=3242485 RepID=UPI003521171B
MHLLIRSARVVDAASPLHNQVVDLHLENGLIRQLHPSGAGSSLPVPEGARLIEGANLHVSAGWVDGRAAANDPGHEHRETLTDLAKAAAAGGFTDVVLLPNTYPVVDSKDTLGYVRRMGDGQPARLHPTAAITKGTKGEDFTDMIDLHRAGAIAFTDGDHPLQNPDLLLKTLQYLQPVGGLLINRPEDTLLTRYGQMHEGEQSTRLGLKGLPAMAEAMLIARDLRLLAYVLDGQPTIPSAPMLHFACLSSAESVALVREAKAKGLPVSCDVAAHQLLFTDADLAGFDTNLKVNPPFRSADDVAALWAGLTDGTIDLIVTDHHPHDEESKNIEFDMAEFGITGLETAFAALLTKASEQQSGTSIPGTSIPGTSVLGTLVDRFTVGPRRVFGLPAVSIAEGQPATLTLFDPTATWTYEKPLSPAKNSPFLGKTLTGKVITTIL